MNPLPLHVASLRPYESARSLWKGDSWIFMDANESPAAETIAIDRLPPLNRYPDPTADALRDALAAFYGVERSKTMIGNGSDEIIDLAVRAFVRWGRAVVSLTPSYGMYRVAAESAGARFVAVPLHGDFSVPEESLLAALVEADLLFLCSPNNPTGLPVELALIERLAATFPGRIVVDEAYGEFADARGGRSAIELVRRGVENVIVLRTFSKAFAAAGIRLGYAIAARDAIDVLVRLELPYNVGSLAQSVGLQLWRRRAAMEANVRRLLDERDRMIRECRRLGCEVFPTATNFFLFQPPGEAPQAAQNLYRSLVDRRRLVVRRFANRPEMDHLLRVSVGLPEENDIFLAAIEGLLS